METISVALVVHSDNAPPRVENRAVRSIPREGEAVNVTGEFYTVRRVIHADSWQTPAIVVLYPAKGDDAHMCAVASRIVDEA